MHSLTLELNLEIEKSKGRAPQPPAEERERRLKKVRKSAERHGLDAVLIFGSAGINPEPIRYLAGYVHVFPSASSFLLIPVDEPPILLVDQAWHLSEAKKMSWVEDVRSFPSGARRWRFDELKTTLADALTTAGLNGGQVGVFETVMPIVYSAALEESAPGIQFVGAKPVWQDIVASPSDYDIEMIKRTAQIADAGQASAVEACAVGRPEYEVCFASLETMASLGAEFLHGSGVSTHVNIGSFSDCISNVRPYLFTGNCLEDGQMFWFDLSASYAGYYTDCCRTISLGGPSQQQQEIYDVCAAMYAAMEESVRPGLPGGELWNIGYRVAEEAGYGDYVNHVYFGHTTGITTSERPVVAQGETAEIREGSFLNIEPGIFVPGVGSADIENTLHVTKDGAEPINQFGTQLHMV